MNTIPRFRLCVFAASLFFAGSAPLFFGQVAPAPLLTPPVESKPKTIASLRIQGGPLPAAVDQLSHALTQERLPEMNVIFSPEARSIAVPDLTLRNVSGPDVLRLITVSSGCDLEEVPGQNGQVIGYRIFPNPAAGGGLGCHTPGFESPPAGPLNAPIPAPAAGAPIGQSRPPPCGHASLADSPVLPLRVE